MTRVGSLYFSTIPLTKCIAGQFIKRPIRNLLPDVLLAYGFCVSISLWMLCNPKQKLPDIACTV